MVTISLTVYAYKTDVEIAVFAGLAFVVCLAMIPMMIICVIMGSPFLHTVYLLLGLIFYSIYLIIDTKMILGHEEEKYHGVSMDHQDYVIGALMLYIDII